MTELSFVASHYFALALLAVCSYIFGRRLTERVSYHSVLEQVSFSITLGLGVIAYLVMFLGLLGQLHRSWLIAGLLLGLIACYPVWFRWARDLPLLPQKLRAFGTGRIALVILGIMIVLALSVPMLAQPLYPPGGFDATMSHLPAAKEYAEKHALVFTPYLRYPVLPQTNQMLFTLALLLYDDILAQLVELLMMVTLVASVIAFGQRYFSTRVGLWAAALLLGNPLVLWLGSLAYIDMGVTFFVTTTVYAFWNWVQSRAQHWLVLSAVLCGFAVGTKSPPLFFLGILTIVALYISLRERKYLPPVLFATIAFLVAAPWIGRSFYYTGNPIFPLFYDTFGRFFGYGHSRPEYYTGMAEAIAATGIGTTFTSLITLPWHLAFNQVAFQVETVISPIYFYALPLLLIFGTTSARIRALLALVLAYTLFWFYTAQGMRFLVTILPLLSLATAAAFDGTLRWLPVVHKLTNYRVITALGFAVLAFPGWTYSDQRLRASGKLPVTQEQRDTYLTRQYPSYPAYKLLKSLKGRNYTLYSMQDENLAYFVDGVYKGDYFGPARYARIFPKLLDGQQLYRQLKSMEADYFLVNHARLKLKLSEDSFFKSHFKQIYGSGNIQLFELTDVPFERRMVNLIQNGHLEELKENIPVGWQFAGQPTVDQSGKQGFNSLVAVRSNHVSDVLYQALSISPGGRYPFSCRARATVQKQKAKLQANWFDGEGRLLREDMKLFEVGRAWMNCELIVIAPAEAARVKIYASTIEPSPVWFDDFSFREMKYVPKVENSEIK